MLYEKVSRRETQRYSSLDKHCINSIALHYRSSPGPEEEVRITWGCHPSGTTSYTLSILLQAHFMGDGLVNTKQRFT